MFYRINIRIVLFFSFSFFPFFCESHSLNPLPITDGIEIVTQFYPTYAVPLKYKNDYGDCTIVDISGWPKNRTVKVTESRLTKPNIREWDPFKSCDITLALCSMGYVPGEPSSLEFKDEKNFTKKIIVYPNPSLTESSIDKAKIEVQLVGVSPILYHLKLDGFVQNEQLIFKSCSYDEVIEHKLLYNEKNKTIIVLPAVVGKQGGINRITFTRASGEVLNLEIPWGLEWMKYFLFFDVNGSVKSYLEDPNIRKDNPEVVKYFESIR